MSARTATVPDAPLVRVEQLHVGLRAAVKPLVEDVGFVLAAGQTLAILGESGSGKTLTLRSLIGGLAREQFEVGGRIELAGQVLGADDGAAAWRALRGPVVAMVYQDPSAALDPLVRVGRQMLEALQAHRAVDLAVGRMEVLEALARVQFPEPQRVFAAYPHELSGGQKQRVAIATALLHRPRLLLADEPTTALDLTIQAQVLRTLRGLQSSHGMAILLVTHDVGVVAEMADRVLVMRHGRVVEQGAVQDVLVRPRHPYTQALLQAKANLLAGLQPLATA